MLLIVFMIMVVIGLFIFTAILAAMMKLIVKLFDKVIFPVWMIKIVIESMK